MRCLVELRRSDGVERDRKRAHDAGARLGEGAVEIKENDPGMHEAILSCRLQATPRVVSWRWIPCA